MRVVDDWHNNFVFVGEVKCLKQDPLYMSRHLHQWIFFFFLKYPVEVCAESPLLAHTF